MQTRKLTLNLQCTQSLVSHSTSAQQEVSISVYLRTEQQLQAQVQGRKTLCRCKLAMPRTHKPFSRPENLASTINDLCQGICSSRPVINNGCESISNLCFNVLSKAVVKPLGFVRLSRAASSMDPILALSVESECHKHTMPLVQNIE